MHDVFEALFEAQDASNFLTRQLHNTPMEPTVSDGNSHSHSHSPSYSDSDSHSHSHSLIWQP